MLVYGKKFIGRNPKFLKAVETAGELASTKVPVLVVGEVGTGKLTLCRYIHESSSRKDCPFMVVDCSQEAESVHNEILGYRDEEGKFHKGVLERSNKGVVVFSNIDSLEEDFQKKLFSILTDLADYDLDLRLLATTSKNLSKYVANGRFNRALYSFFSTTQIFMPSIRDRREDFEELATHFASETTFSKDWSDIIISADAVSKLSTMYFSYNITEFKGVIEGAAKCCDNGLINAQAIEQGEKQSESSVEDKSDDALKLMSLRDAERLLIKKALIHTSENRTQAAKILGVSIRTLRNKINEYRSDGTEYFVNLR